MNYVCGEWILKLSFDFEPIYIYIYTYIHTYTHIYIYVYIHIYIYRCKYGVNVVKEKVLTTGQWRSWLGVCLPRSHLGLTKSRTVWLTPGGAKTDASSAGYSGNQRHSALEHDNLMTWKRFLHYWTFLRGIHRPLVDSPHKGPYQHKQVV